MEGYNEENRSSGNFDPITGERIIKEENTYSDPSETADPIYHSWESSKSTADDNDFGYQKYHFSDEAPSEEKKSKKKKEKKPMGIGKRFAVVIAMALVFGLVGGTVFYGVNYIGNRLIGYNPSVTETADAAAKSIPIENAEQTIVKSSSTIETEQTEKPEMSVALESGNTATESTGTVAQVAANCMPSLVTIASISVVEMQNFFGQTQQYEAEGAGSGVIVGQNDTELLIATNNHVVANAKELSVGFIDETSVEAFVKGTDSDNDLAVVAVKLEDIPAETLNQIRTATIGKSDDLVLGEQVVAIGNALGLGQSVTSGYVSALHRDLRFSDGSYTIESTDLIQTDAPINSGNSGGGLFNMKGELIGINEAKSSMSSSGTTVDGVGYAISIDKAEPILQNLMSLETRETVAEENAGYLGVTCADVTADIAQMYKMPEGVCFTSVLENSPAAAAGAQKGDVLIRFDGREIGSYDNLKSVLAYYAAGETVNMTVLRMNAGEYEEVELTITLGSYEEIQKLQQNG